MIKFVLLVSLFKKLGCVGISSAQFSTYQTPTPPNPLSPENIGAVNLPI
jgi:hypothetical protein